MAWQPHSTLRLRVRFEEVCDWLSGFGWTSRPLHEASSHFLASCCIVMQRLFEEYGAVLARRPWDIYFIDLRDIFRIDRSISGNVLGGFYEDYGLPFSREADIHLDKYHSPRPLQDKKPSHLQLQPIHRDKPGILDERIFLVDDERRNVYIWGYTTIQANIQRLFVQHSQTGQRLPPSVDFSGDSDRNCKLISYEMSADGRHLALLYITRPSLFALNAPLDNREVTVIWRIEENVSFKRRMNCEPWASVVSSHKSKTGLRAVSSMNDRFCITPSGMLDVFTSIIQPLPERLSYQLVSPTEKFFRCNGHHLFLYKLDLSDPARTVTRVDPFEPILSVKYSWVDEERVMVDVSPTGRYLVLFSRISPKIGALYLYDTDSNETIQLDCSEPPDYRKSKFHFSRNETRLVTFLAGQSSFGVLFVNVLIWDCLGTIPTLTEDTRFLVDSSLMSEEIYIDKDGSSGVFVTGAKSLQRKELGDETKSLDFTDVTDEYPNRRSTTSRDGSHWALLSYGPKDGQLQIIDLTSFHAPTRFLKLEWSQSDIPTLLTLGVSSPRPLSSDFSVLVINAQVFVLATAEGDVPLVSFTIEGLPALLDAHARPSAVWRCHISSCNRYVITWRGAAIGEIKNYMELSCYFVLTLYRGHQHNQGSIYPRGYLIHPPNFTLRCL